jgi:rubrerythrin
MLDDALDHWTQRRVWRLTCAECGHTWRGRSAEATPCPHCESWAVTTAHVEALEEEPC